MRKNLINKKLLIRKINDAGLKSTKDFSEEFEKIILHKLSEIIETNKKNNVRKIKIEQKVILKEIPVTEELKTLENGH
jgi:hypothetical protein